MTYTVCIVCRRRIPTGTGGRCGRCVSPARRIRRTKEWTELSRQVRARGICDLCGTPTPPVELEAHHVVPLARAPSRGLDRSNVIAACRPCHYAQKSRVAHM